MEAYFGPQPTSSRDLPNPETWSRHFLQATAEALAGLRPVAQLRAATSVLVFERLRRTAQRTDRSRTLRPASPPMIRSVRVCEPADGVAEVAAVLRRGATYRAVAARIEGIDGGWRCVSFSVL